MSCADCGSAGDYPLEVGDNPSDFQKPCLRRRPRFIGTEVAGESNAAPTLTTPEMLTAVKEKAAIEAREFATRF